MKRHHAPQAIWRLVPLLLASGTLLPPVALAQGLPFDPHEPPAFSLPGTGGSEGGVGDWLEENRWTLLAFLSVALASLIVYLYLSKTARTKRLQRDALERLRKSLIESCRATHGPAKAVLLTGGPRDPATRLGRYLGHHRSVEAVWICYRPTLLGRPRLLAVNPVDLNGLDVLHLHVRAIAVNVTRDFGFAVPDVHDDAVRADWQRASPTPLPDAGAFAEAWKAYFAAVIDNAVAFSDSLTASEDRSFLRQEVTRGQDELTDTIVAPVKPAPTPQEASADA